MMPVLPDDLRAISDLGGELAGETIPTAKGDIY
jgi:hypothetical protein